MMLLTLDTAATAWPVTLAEARADLRIIGTDEDTLVTAQIATATSVVSEMSGLELTTQVWSMAVASVSGDLALPKVPVQSVGSISYYDADGVSQAAVVTDFHLFKDDFRATLRPKPGKSWPTLQTRDDALTVSFTAGQLTVPPALKQAVLFLVAHLYENREAIAETALSAIPFGVADMVNLHRRGWFGA